MNKRTDAPLNVLTYRGYGARIEYDVEDRILFGHLAGIRDIVGFHGETPDELEAAFREAVDDYLEFCAQEGRDPQKPYSGQLSLRMDPEVHRRAVEAAKLAGLSMNKWAERALSEAADRQ